MKNNFEKISEYMKENNLMWYKVCFLHNTNIYVLKKQKHSRYFIYSPFINNSYYGYVISCRVLEKILGLTLVKSRIFFCR